MMRKLAVAAGTCLLTLAVGRSALVSVSTNTTIGGSAAAPVYNPTSAAQQDFWSPVHYRTNVYLHDAPNTPLHERIGDGGEVNLFGYVTKTNGAWVIVQSTDWNGIEWNGDRVFGVVLDGAGGSGAQITKLAFDEDSLVLTFIGADTNHLEACNDCTNWFTWDGCSWAYDGIVGTVTIPDADGDYWYRVVADGQVYGWSNASVVSYAPLYVGSQSNAENRVATLGDLRAVQSSVQSSSGGKVARRAYKDAHDVSPTNIVWNLDQYGVPYFANLAVGGWEIPVVTTNGNEIETNVITQSGLLSVSGGIQFAGSTNQLSYGDGKLLFGGRRIDGVANIEAGHGITITDNTNTDAKVIAVNRNIDFDNVTIFGDLNVSGTQHHNTIIRHETNVYVGVRTNYVTTEVHTTNHVYQYTHIVTRDTNYVDQVVNVGGNVDNSKADYVLSPVYSIDNSDTNAPSLTGSGSWDLSLATVALGANAVSSFNGWSGAVSIAAGTNIVFDIDNAGHVVTIKAIVPEVDFSPYATKAEVAGVAAGVGAISTNITEHTGAMTNYVTAAELSRTLEDYAPASEVTLIATNMEEIVSALSNPVIQTPDHRKWTMQGRYVDGRITHVWVPYVGLYSSSIRVPMPDGRVFEMVGRYADGDTNRVTHTWEEITE